MEKYVFVEYNSNYEKMFLFELGKLRKILGKTAEIEHIGSTAIPGMGGKGIIDILIAVDKSDMESAAQKIEGGRYERNKTGGDSERIFFEKIYPGEERLVHVHLTFKNSREWKKTIGVRDFLRKNKKAAEEYSRIKREAVKNNKKGKDYRDFKREFLGKIAEDF